MSCVFYINAPEYHIIQLTLHDVQLYRYSYNTLMVSRVTLAPRLLYSSQWASSQLLLQQLLPLYLLFGQSLKSHRHVLSAHRFLMDQVSAVISLEWSTEIITIQQRLTVPGPIWLSTSSQSMTRSEALASGRHMQYSLVSGVAPCVPTTLLSLSEALSD